MLAGAMEGAKMQAYFNRFTIAMTLDDARSVSHQGRCDDDVAAFLDSPKGRKLARKLAPLSDAIRAELREYGAWDDEELADDAENLTRLVWCAAGDIVGEVADKQRGRR